MSEEHVPRAKEGTRSEKRRHDLRDPESSILTAISGVHVEVQEGFFRYDCSGSYARWNVNRRPEMHSRSSMPDSSPIAKEISSAFTPGLAKTEPDARKALLRGAQGKRTRSCIRTRPIPE